MPRDIIYSLCQYGWGDVWEWGAEKGIDGNSWRTTGDITDTWESMNGIGFQQDGLEYGTRTHHSNADTYDRVQTDDVMQSSMIEAWFAYNAATRAEMLPRIPTPAPDPNAKSHE